MKGNSLIKNDCCTHSKVLTAVGTLSKKNTVIIAVFQGVVRLANCNSLIIIIKSLCIRNNLTENSKRYYIFLLFCYEYIRILSIITKGYSFRKSSTRQYKLNIFLIQTTIIYSKSTTTYVYVRHVFVLYLWESIFKLVHSALQKCTSQNCNFDLTKFLSHKKFVFK